jgi:aldoxime dehydratase
VTHYYVAYYGVQAGPAARADGENAENATAHTAQALDQSAFCQWVELASTSPFSPGACDHSRFVDKEGFLNHVFSCHWTDEERFQSWKQAKSYQAFWDAKERVDDGVGCWREEMRVDVECQETVYFRDFMRGIGACESAKIRKADHAGYYGSMRDRIPNAKVDGPDAVLPEPIIRESFHARLQVHAPEFLTIIHSGQFWKRCQEVQRADYFARLEPALKAGMQYLDEHPVETGCCSIRYMRNCDLEGRNSDESSAIGYFLSLDAMEQWAKSHASHEKIYTIAKQQLKDPNFRRELRTYHEVFVLPFEGHFFEYTNCQPMTGLLPYFDVTRKA